MQVKTEKPVLMNEIDELGYWAWLPPTDTGGRLIPSDLE